MERSRRLIGAVRRRHRRATAFRGARRRQRTQQRSSAELWRRLPPVRACVRACVLRPRAESARARPFAYATVSKQPLYPSPASPAFASRPRSSLRATRSTSPCGSRRPSTSKTSSSTAGCATPKHYCLLPHVVRSSISIRTHQDTGGNGSDAAPPCLATSGPAGDAAHARTTNHAHTHTQTPPHTLT